MNVTLKALCGLVKNENDVELQCAAIRVLGAINPNEGAVYRTLGEQLIASEDPRVFQAILSAIEVNPHEQSLKYLMDILEREDGHLEQVQNAIANIGGRAVPHLKRYFDRITSQARLLVVQILPRIRTDQAHALLVECFFSPDHDLVRESVHALREEIGDYESKERADLYARLKSTLRDRRVRDNQAALSAAIIALGILAEPKSRDLLLPFVDKENPPQIRRHALMSLAQLEFAGETHRAVMTAVLPILDESDWEEVVRHAVSVLLRVKPRRSDTPRLHALLENPLPGVQAYAIRALGQINSITNAEKVLPFLHHGDVRLREAARGALREMASAATVILRHLDRVKGSEAREMVDILESHGNRIKPDKAREMFAHMFELYKAGDDHFELYAMALRHLRKEVFRDEAVKVANQAWGRKNFAEVRDALKLLDKTDLITPEIRFRLAMAKLKTSRKERSRAFRDSDYCLEHIAILLRDDPKSFKRKFLAEKALDPEDLFYVGFHFSEKLNEERRFGADVLRHVAKKWSRRQTGKAAKKKLEVEGH